MSENPKTMDCNALAADARTLMETHEISQLLVLKDNKYSGVIHIHDLIKEGII
jgi:arabinose-5-phosphate isomerase